VLVVVMGSILFFQWLSGAFMELQGYLLISGPVKETAIVSNLDARKVYRVALDGQYAAIPYFTISNFDEIRLSERIETGDVYVVKHYKEKYYAVLLVKDNVTQELMRSSTPIHFPTIRNNGKSIIFFGRNADSKQDYYLYNYDTQMKIVKRISTTPVVWWSRPMFTPKGEMIYAKLGEYTLSAFRDEILIKNATIVLIHENGEQQDIVKGIFPVWHKNGKSFYYYDFLFKEIHYYDITTNVDEVIVKKTWVLSHPVLSENGNYLAFHELKVLGEVAEVNLQIMTVDGLTKRTIYNSKVPLSYYNKRVGDIWWSW
jgi:hypothetical protein